MWKQRQIAVIIPAFNEADKIEMTLASVPAYVDLAIVINDASEDRTGDVARAFAAHCPAHKVMVIDHPHNQGVGAAINTGYAHAFAQGVDVTAVMAGDAQMDPADLGGLLDLVITGACDYAKGNRFANPGVYRVMPLVRLLGNWALSLMTRVATGMHHVFDSQCGFTAANRLALRCILTGPLFPRYGYPNAVLLRLGQCGVRVQDAPVRAVYGPQWRSGIKPVRVMGPVSWLLLCGLCARGRRAFYRGRLMAPRSSGE